MDTIMEGLRAAARVWGLAAAAVLASCQSAGTTHARFVPPAAARPSTGKPFLDDAADFRFAIVSDRTGGARPGIFEQAIRDLNMLRPAFAIGVGDLVEGYATGDGLLEREWRDVDGMIGKLDMRFFYVSGNHDLSNDKMVRLWTKRSGRPYYSFLYKDVLFVVLDTDDPPGQSPIGLRDLFPEPGRSAEIEALLKSNPRHANELISARLQKMQIPLKELTPASISDAQVEWVGDTLAANKAVHWTIVLMHKPAWLYDNANFAKIQALLAGRRYTVFAGHEHYYQHDIVGGRDYFRLGTTGGEWIRKGSGAVDHISWVTMTGAGPKVANIRVGGMFGAEGPDPVPGDLPRSK